jgi:hypothetical protein
VIVENKAPKPGWYSGLADTYLRVNFPSERDVRGELVYVTVTDAAADSVEGHLVE